MKFALLATILAINFLLYPTLVEAVSDDDELSIMAAEQRKDDDANVTVREDVEIFDSRSATTGSEKSIDDGSNAIITENLGNEDNSKINEDAVPANTNFIDNVKKMKLCKKMPMHQIL